VIIVGSGAGGGTLAHRLAPSGKRVLILERGDWLPREIENWDATAVFVNNRYVSEDTWYDEDGNAQHLIPRDIYMKNDIPVAGCAHQAGTARFGTDPTSSVLDANCSPRAGQPLRRRHELLPEHRGSEPGPNRNGQCPARRRPPAVAAQLASRVVPSRQSQRGSQ
jgi:choline dehydrogenase-like flavoprotein